MEIINDKIYIHENTDDYFGLLIPLENDKNYQFRTGDELSFIVAKSYDSKENVIEKKIIIDKPKELVIFELTKEDTNLECTSGQEKKYIYNILLNNNRVLIGSDYIGNKEFVILPKKEMKKNV